MTITSREFWAEVKSIAHNVLTEYEHDAINSISELQSELADLQAELTASLNEHEDTDELQQAIADKETEIADAIEALTTDDLDDIYDKVHEQVDGHEWVIYYSKAWDVAHLMSGDENACSEFEELCSIEHGESLDNLICQFAFCAINSNVVAEMEAALEEYKIELAK
jgi:acetylornithine deacetylase/succinyl-diaminopimelate desuccinylase-like protein